MPLKAVGSSRSESASCHESTPGIACTVVEVAIVGASGRVARGVLELIDAQAVQLRGDGLQLRIVVATNSRTLVFPHDRLAAACIPELLAAAPPLADAAQVVALTRQLRPQILLDCSASASVAALYPQWLAAGIDVVTPNKQGSSADHALARAIGAAQTASGAALRDSSTVGAQLPLLSTLRELRRAGDRVERLEAVLSGTLSYVLSRVQQGVALSAAVRDAVACGYAEPHPASDLSGEDAARKLVILLRAFGHDLDLKDVECVPLVDAALLDTPDPVQLLAGLDGADKTWRARAAVADVCHECWVYRASFENGHARVAPERVPLTHALARLAPCENALILHSAYYRVAPLTISGPGAGIELTAASVFADLIAAAQRHVALSARHDLTAEPAVVAAA